MNVILLLFFFSVLKKVICVEENGDSKYIDLLPEKDKQDFLDKIARRILDEIKSKGVPKNPATEVPDEQLDEHNEFVQKIIKEEAENLRITKKNYTELRSESNKPLESEDRSAKTFFDLTLRHGSSPINKMRETVIKINDTNNDIIFPVQVSNEGGLEIFNVTENVTGINKNDLRRMANREELTTTDFLDVSTIKIKPKDEIGASGDDKLTNGQSIEQTTLAEKNEINKTKDKIKNNNENATLKEANLNLKNFDDISEKNDASNNNDFTTLSHETLPENHNFSNVRDYNSTEIITVLYPNDESHSETTTYFTTISDSGLKDVTTVQLDQNNNKEINIKNVFEKVTESNTPKMISDVEVAKDIKNTYDKKDNITDFGNNLQILTTSKNILENVGKGLSNDDSLKQPKIIVSTSLEDIANNINIKDKIIETNSESVNVNIVVQKHVIADDIPKNLRDILKEVLKSDEHGKKLKPKLKKASQETKSIAKPETYVVFEMLADKPTFVQKPITQQISHEKPPHYAPVYNYDPSNAYFNSHNRLGPNVDEEEIVGENIDKSKHFGRSRNESEVSESKNLDIKTAAAKPPFAPKSNVKQPTDKEQPHYAPVYNYDPSNAYFNSHNRLSPNNDEEETMKENVERESKHNDSEENSDPKYKSDEYRKFRVGNRHAKKHRMRTQKLHELLIRLPIVHKKKKYNNVHFHADNYFDMDYYYSRLRNEDITSGSKKLKARKNDNNEVEGKDNAGKQDKEPEVEKEENKNGEDLKHENEEYEKSKESEGSESDGFLQEILGGKKTYMDQIRHYMYENKHFGYITDITDKESGKNRTTDNVESISQNSDEVAVLFGIQPKYYRQRSLKKNDDQYSHKIHWQSEEIFPINDHSFSKPKFKWQKKKKANIKVMKPSSDSKINENQIKDAIANIRPKIRILGKLLGNKIKNMIEPWLSICLDHPNSLKCKKTYEKYRQKQKTIPGKNFKKKKHVTTYDFEKSVIIFLDVLSDMIKTNNEGLKKYDWLGTAVDIQAALNKLTILINDYQKGREINTKDLQLLDYIAYLYKSSKNTLKYKSKTSKTRYSRFSLKGRSLLPKSRKLTNHKIKNPLSQLDKARHQLRSDMDETKDKQSYDELLDFVNDLTDYLSDFHNAIKHIAMVTKYKKQRWYDNLKELYIGSPTKKVLIQILLHMFSTKVLALIEESAENGLQEDYKLHVHQNHKEVTRIKEELTTILALMREIKD